VCDEEHQGSLALPQEASAGAPAVVGRAKVIDVRAVVDPPEPFTDEALSKVLVGDLQPGRVTLVDYDPTWPAAYARHRARIEQALADRIRLIEHIGSTAVPELAAKPIIDVVVAVDNPEDEGSYLDDLVRVGYEVRVREPGHRCLRFSEGEPANVHCYAPESVEIRRYLALRDRLRAHADERAWYEATKRELAQREWKDVNYYAEAKGPVIRAILKRAGFD
jgi:GrpB-like predicted nucleotidyltransferase (UPF0157 family)